jgi:hypothetical protein
MNIKILVLSVKDYSIVDKETGNVIEGISIRYIPQGTSYENGSLELAKASLPLDEVLLQKFSKLPVTCDAVFNIKADSMGKASVKLTGFKDIKPYDLKF